VRALTSPSTEALAELENNAVPRMNNARAHNRKDGCFRCARGENEFFSLEFIEIISFVYPV
jgi:hypothetical protein